MEQSEIMNKQLLFILELDVYRDRDRVTIRSNKI
jgi:hypothetical protein